MKCPKCRNLDTRVIDSRTTEDGKAIRRRRECEKCGRLWLQKRPGKWSHIIERR